MQTDPEDVSLMYLTLGAAYNAKEMKPQAIEAFRKVTAGPAVEPQEEEGGLPGFPKGRRQ